MIIKRIRDGTGSHRPVEMICCHTKNSEVYPEDGISLGDSTEFLTRILENPDWQR